MSYLVLARKYRPQTFEEVIGQDHITRTLANAISMDRVAHAILFSGPRGTGKTTVARILAKTMNCKKGPAQIPCNECSSCNEITTGRAVDVFEIDGASNNSVDQIRELRENLDDIRIVSGDTETTPIDVGSFIGAAAYCTGNAVQAAASDARRQLFEMAAAQLEANVDDLEAKDRWIYVKGSPDCRACSGR